MLVRTYVRMIIRKKNNLRMYAYRYTKMYCNRTKKHWYRFNIRYSKTNFWFLVSNQQGVKMVKLSNSIHLAPKHHNEGELHCELLAHIETNCLLSHLPFFFKTVIFLMLRILSSKSLSVPKIVNPNNFIFQMRFTIEFHRPTVPGT